MNRPVLSWLLLAMLAFIWGSSYILMKLGMEDADGNHYFSPNQVGSLRVIFAGLVISPVLFKRYHHLFTKDVIWLLCVGLLGNLIPAVLFTNAEKHLSTSYTGTLNSLVPIFSFLVAVFVFKRKVSKLGILGIGIGFIGAVFLIIFKDGDFSSYSIGAIFMVIIATICYAFSLNIIRERLSHLNSITITGLSLFLVIPGGLILYFLEPNPEAVITRSYLPSLWYILILAIIGTTIALIIFNYLIKISSAIFASSVTYLIPFVAIGWGWIINEKLSWSMIFIFLVISGIYLTRKEK